MVRISKTTNSGYVRLVLEVNETSTNIQANTSTISWQLWLERGSTWAFDLNNESLAEVEINGQYTLSKYVNFDLRNSQWATFGSGTMTIPHNEDGTKSITIWARLTNIADQGSINWFSGTVNLSNIPRASAISSVSATELGQPVTIQIDKKVSSFTHQIWWRINSSEWVDEGGNHDTSLTITPSIEYANRITDSDTGNLDVSVRTFNGDAQIGEDVYKFNVPIRVPESIVPTLEDVTITERNAQLAEFIPAGNFVKIKSVMRVEAINAVGSHGSTIVSTELTVDNLVVRASTGDFPANKVGNLEVTAKITDSRGRTATKSKTIKVWDYYAPRIIAFLANRTGNGTNKTIMATVAANVSPLVIDGVNRNPYTLKIQYSAKKDNRWIDAVVFTNESTERINRQFDCGAFYELSKAYNIRLVIQDRLSDLVDSVLIVRSAKVLWAWGDNRAAVGGFPELEGHFESFLPVAFHSSLNVEDGLMSRGKPIQEFQLTQQNGKSLQAKGSANDILTAGFYYSNNMSGLPAELDWYQKFGYLQVSTHPNDDNFAMQTYVPNNTDVMYMRRKVNTYGWLPWVKFTPEGTWKLANLQNGWRHFDGDDGALEYKKEGNTIKFRGSITGGNAKNYTNIFSLPDGYRPSKKVYLVAFTGYYNTCSIIVFPNGEVKTGVKVESDWVCLDNMEFSI